MWYPPTISGASALLTPAEVRVQCGDASLSDAVCARMVAAETGFVEKYCAIRLSAQVAVAKCDDFCDFRVLPIAPAREITSITYIDTDGTSQTLAPSVYELRADGLISAIVLKYNQAWPSIQPGSRITVEIQAGYAAGQVPAEILQAILLRITKLNTMSRSDPMLRKRVVEGVGSREWDTSGTVDKAMSQAVGDLLENYRSWAALA